MNLLSHYEKFQSAHPAVDRTRALDFAKAHGLPTRHDEDWKYTSLKAWGEKSLVPAEVKGLDEEQAKSVRSAFRSDAINLVFVNGVHDKNLSQQTPEILEVQVGLQEKTAFADALEALNSLYALQGYRFSIPKGEILKRPVHLIFYSSGNGVMNCPQVRVDLQAQSRSRFLISFMGEEREYLTNAVLDFQVGEGAKLELISVQEESLQAAHIARLRIHLQKETELENLIFATGASLGRTSLEVLLNGEGARAQVHGLYAVSGRQHVDNNTTIDHRVGHGDTQQLYKGLLDGESRAVFNGKVLIRRHAQKANSEQLNNNLLLSRKAEADSKPMLEIDADDVKASHGSTVGQLNKEELFYLLSRAIPKSKALPMLSYGFLSEVLYRVSDKETREWLKGKLDRSFERLEGNLP